MSIFKLKTDSGESKWPALTRIMLGRLVVLAAILVVLIVRIPLDAQAAYAVIALAFVVNIPYALWLRKDGSIRSSAPLQFLIDVVVITGIVHFTGGIESELFLLYPLVILSSGIVVSAMHSLKIAIFCILAYATLIVLEMEGVMPFHGHHADAYDNVASITQNLMTRIFIFVIFSAASHLLASRCNYQAQRLRSYQDWVMTVFDNVSLGIITLSPERRVIFVNRTAAKLLEFSPEHVEGMPISELFAEPAPSLRDPLEEARPWQMKCGPDKSFPAMFTASRANFPVDPDSEPGIFQDVREREVIIIAFRDVTREIKSQKDLLQAERLHASFEAGVGLTKTVQTPLEALRSCTELLCQIIGKRNGHPPKISTDELRQAEELAGVILNQSNRINRSLSQFLVVHTSEQRDKPA